MCGRRSTRADRGPAVTGCDVAGLKARLLTSWQGAAAAWEGPSQRALKAACVPAVLVLALYLLGMLGRGQP